MLDEKSVELLLRCDVRLANIITMASDVSDVRFRVTETARTVENQREYYRKGVSKVNPDTYTELASLYKAAKHIVGPGMPKSRAVDIAIVGKEPYHVASLSYVAGVVATIAKSKGTPVRWGGDFDRDGVIVEAGTFQDLPHFELDL